MKKFGLFAIVVLCIICMVSCTNQCKDDEHVFEEKITVKATCSKEGAVTKTCTECGLVKEEKIKATGKHKLDEGTVTKEASCTEEGELTYKCKACNEKITEKIEKLEHTFDEGVVTEKTTCYAEGEKLFTCTVCKEEKKEVVAKIDHNYSDVKVTKNATCFGEGEKALTCVMCAKTKTEATAKIDHNYKSEITVTATCQKDGTKKCTCVMCGKSYTETIKGEHNFTEKNCDVPRYCKVCNYKPDSDALPPLYYGMTTRHDISLTTGKCSKCSYDATSDTYDLVKEQVVMGDRYFLSALNNFTTAAETYPDLTCLRFVGATVSEFANTIPYYANAANTCGEYAGLKKLKENYIKVVEILAFSYYIEVTRDNYVEVVVYISEIMSDGGELQKALEVIESENNRLSA